MENSTPNASQNTNLPPSQTPITPIQPASKPTIAQTTLPKKPKSRNFIMATIELIVWLLIIIVGANLIHKYIFHPFYVIGPSMEPSFQERNYLFVEKVSYHFNPPTRGDVIVFTPPWDDQNINAKRQQESYGQVKYFFAKWLSKFGLQSLIGISGEVWEDKQYIKRIIGLPNETVSIDNSSHITIKNTKHPEGITIDETTYIDRPTKGSLEITLKDGEYFVMGDNRTNSSDSRGALSSDGTASTPHIVPLQSIEGKVSVRLWPINKIGIIPNPEYKNLE
ncbi:MAG: signal peptidase I [bacterium]